MNWKLDQKNTEDYIALCEKAALPEDDIAFDTFRSAHPMTLIVENSPEKSGREYYDHINMYAPHYLKGLEKFQSSDLIGSPRCYEYDDYIVSPTTLRYIKTLVDLETHFGSLNDFTIAEIGGGYGGLCKIIHDAWKPKKYLLFDIPEANALQKKFLSHFEIEPQIGDLKKNLPKIDLLIAMYSWSELSDELQMVYLEKLIKKAKYSYIMLNYDMEASYNRLKDALPNAEITDHNIFYDDNNTEYAPYNRFIIIKNTPNAA